MDDPFEYPPDPQRSRALFQELKELDEKYPQKDYPQTFHPRKYEIIHDLTEAHFYEAKEYFIRGLDSADADYRYECISALATHWGLTDSHIVSKLIDKAKYDPDEQVRLIALDSRGNLRIQSSLSLLKGIALDDEEPSGIQRIAYRAIVKISGRSLPSIVDSLDSLFDENFSLAEIDRDLLDDLS
jgi:hypothetical protein